MASSGSTPVAFSRGGDQPFQDETPGRSPQRRVGTRETASQAASIGGSDPLVEGLGLLAGVTIGLLTLVVPLLSVISDRGPGSGMSAEPPSGIGRRR